MAIPNDINSLKTLVSTLLLRLEAFEKEVEVLTKENEELRRRLGLDSHNSHKPPSSDGLKKAPALPKKSGLKAGGQAGHKGKTLEMSDTPSQIIVYLPSSCTCCNRTFKQGEVQYIKEKRQIYDLPKPELEVTEHQTAVIICCGVRNTGVFPENISARVQYGNNIKALSVLLNVDFRMPFDKINQLFFDLYNCSFNPSTAISSNNTFYEALLPVEQIIKERIIGSKLAHFDETGMRVLGKLHWFHVACTSKFTYLFVHAKRGKEAIGDTMSIVQYCLNWVLHDCWASYFIYKLSKHAICNAHILRELVNLNENGSVWAKKMHELLMEMYKTSGKATIILPNKVFWEAKYLKICAEADLEEPPPEKGKKGKPKNSKGRNLLNRLITHQDGVLAFAFVEEVPFTNNQAERDIRCVKIKQKVAMSFRTFEGAQVYARIQGFVSTTRKHNHNVFDEIVKILNNKKCFLQEGC
jgi:transposase